MKKINKGKWIERINLKISLNHIDVLEYIHQEIHWWWGGISSHFFSLERLKDLKRTRDLSYHLNVGRLGS
jgi:hypothetical protein